MTNTNKTLTPTLRGLVAASPLAGKLHASTSRHGAAGVCIAVDQRATPELCAAVVTLRNEIVRLGYQLVGYTAMGFDVVEAGGAGVVQRAQVRGDRDPLEGLIFRFTSVHTTARILS